MRCRDLQKNPGAIRVKFSSVAWQKYIAGTSGTSPLSLCNNLSKKDGKDNTRTTKFCEAEKYSLNSKTNKKVLILQN